MDNQAKQSNGQPIYKDSSELVPVKFKATQDLRMYTGLDHDNSNLSVRFLSSGEIVEVSPAKAEQLIADHPKNFETVDAEVWKQIKAAVAQHAEATEGSEGDEGNTETDPEGETSGNPNGDNDSLPGDGDPQTEQAPEETETPGETPAEATEETPKKSGARKHSSRRKANK